VTVTTIDPNSSNVMRVTELNWLLARDAGLSYIGGSIDCSSHPNNTTQKK
jgi:hypothetical protein